MVYQYLLNPDNDWKLWAYAEFTSGDPPTEDIRTGDPNGGPQPAAQDNPIPRTFLSRNTSNS